MNTAVTFDTLRFVETLEAANISGEQARAIASTVRDMQVSAEVATKGDVAAVQADVVAVRADVVRLDAKVEALGAKVDLLKWLTGAVLVAVLAPLIKALF